MSEDRERTIEGDADRLLSIIQSLAEQLAEAEKQIRILTAAFNDERRARIESEGKLHDIQRPSTT